MSDLEQMTGKRGDEQTTQTLQLDVESCRNALIFLFANAVLVGDECGDCKGFGKLLF